MKLRTKIPLLLVPLIVLSLLALGWYAYGQLRAASEQRVFGEMRLLLDHLREHMETEMETARGNIELLSKQVLVKKYILTEDEDERYTLLQPSLLRLFSSYQEAFPEYYELRIFLPDGYEDIRLTRPYLDNVTDEEGNTALFQALQSSNEDVYSAVFRNPDNKKISLFAGKKLVLNNPAVDQAGAEPKLRGYVGVTIDMGELESFVHEHVISHSGYLFVTDDQGNVYFESSSRPVGDVIPASFLASVQAHDEQHWQPLLTAFNDESAFITAARLRGDLYAYAVLPEKELRQVTYQVAGAVAAITLLTILVTMFLVMIVMEHQVIRPIHRLRVLAREIGSGNLSIRVNRPDTNDEIGELATAFGDMAGNLERSNERIQFLAYHDALTGLPNRAMFRKYLDRSVEHARRNHQMLGMLFLDIDDFKQINDTMGHQAGDILLQAIAERLTNALRGNDFIALDHPHVSPDEALARLGGDEFIILLPGIQDSFAPSMVAERLIELVTTPVPINGQDCYVSASIGITLYPSDGTTADELIKNADIAMYHAKERGKNAYEYFESSMNTAAQERARLENRLRNALDQNQFELHYQPQIHGPSRAIAGVEALLRWQHPEDGLIPPNEFIPLAERSGLILPIGEWVIREACRQARAWQQAGYPLDLMSVNVSSIQIARQDVAAIIREALAESGLDPGCLEIEITESAIMSDPESAVQLLEEIKSIGVSIALDDFGTGYSSLSYLRRFPIDTLKIDRDFVNEIDEKPEDAEIIAAITAMAHTLRLRVVVEGVERESQLDIALDRKCDVIQGYLFCAPLPADRVVDLLAERILKFG